MQTPLDIDLGQLQRDPWPFATLTDLQLRGRQAQEAALRTIRASAAFGRACPGTFDLDRCVALCDRVLPS